ncbi:uncharacterized protein LOC132283754 [Cornus florida]|uniref:uncharacterized protein LOC132283754 n=1 Tax=Cornus florida TaxID=4283 RepID=UPI00289F8D76|nr:uncharacterized protein LOC132283754 [Cornus florida]
MVKMMDGGRGGDGDGEMLAAEARCWRQMRRRRLRILTGMATWLSVWVISNGRRSWWNVDEISSATESFPGGDDLIQEILQRLPSKSLMRFKSVSKTCSLSSPVITSLSSATIIGNNPIPRSPASSSPTVVQSLKVAVSNTFLSWRIILLYLDFPISMTK